jgi:hypothetical protein
MDAPDFNPSRAVWRTSSYTNNGGACVEVANMPGVVAVRDSKDRHGPVLAFDHDDWQTFIGQIKGE